MGTKIGSKYNFKKQLRIMRWSKGYDIRAKNNVIEIKRKRIKRVLKRYI